MTRIKPGDVVHFLSDLTYCQQVGQFPAGVVAKRGDEVTITDELLEANTNRLGNLAPWLLEAHDPDAQIRRWGQQRVGVGPWPKDLLTTAPATPEHEDARRRAVRAAYGIANESEREAALCEIKEKFGPPRPSNVSIKYGAVR